MSRPATWLRLLAISIAVFGCAATIQPGPTAGGTPLTTRSPAASPSPAPSPPVATPVATPVAVACPPPPDPSTKPSTDPIATDAVDGILAMFADAPIVAIGEYHGWVLEHEFFARLVCDPRFAETVDEIVVEFGNARLQPILDAYVAGDTVGLADLASVWRQSTQRSGVWEHPVYQAFFGLIRTVNADLPPDRRIRVLAGDPPIDFTLVTRFSGCSDLDPGCLDYWLQARDAHFADVVAREVLAKGRTALVIAGVGHVMRRPGMEHPVSIPELVEADRGATTIVVIPHLGFGAADPGSEARIEAWPVPGIGRLAGTWLGGLDACLLESDVGAPPAAPCDGGEDAGTIADVADAYLYLGYP
jgi:hypothetical protein